MNPKLYPEATQPIATADIETSPTGTDLIETYDASNQNDRKAIAVDDLLTGVLRNVRVRATAAEINAAGGKVVIPAKSGYKIRIVDMFLIAYGGAATTATSVDLVGTRSAGEVRPLVVAVAALTQSAVVRAGAANAAVLADGASFTQLDAGTAVSIQKQSGGSNLAGATGVDAVVKFVYER